ncbi:hypothetical protein Dsin_013245 [Dipteronia sinensis]|uniref:Prephenate/arogenate dehydrogenase domain-containing protein n=1 Tax=Dipteronia sinensis TaxID=43782 RepID=A0AAE0AKF5_9ROSI|nr:hypothetical protein Dsin_013245 [Dipteronia sinensis]
MLFSSITPRITATATATTTANPSLLPHSTYIPSISLPFSSSSKPLRPSSRLRIRAIDAAQPFDYESKLQSQYLQSTSLKIAIVGFGNFGQFLAKAFVRHNHTLLLHSRSDYSHIARQLNAHFYTDIHDLCEQHPDVVLICTSILSTETVLKSIPFQRLKRSTLFVDVLSVKEFPRNLFFKYLPQEFDILCTHPMFGPESGKDSWVGLPFVYDKVRLGDDDEERVTRVGRFLDIFANEGCRMVEMSCAEHDRYAAGSQFVTHTMGRVLERFGVESSPINTKGYETLLDLVENTKGDSFELYYGLFMYNNNSLEQLERLDMAFEAIKKDLFGQLHQVYRKQLFGDSEEEKRTHRSVQKLLPNGAHVEPPKES